MYKDREKQREVTKDRVRRYRDKQKGVTELEGVTIKFAADDICSVTYPDIIDKLTDPTWRGKLEKICHAFQASSNPSYSKDVWLGDTNMSTVCDWLECTR